jgi:hypothetical protein
MTKENPSIEIEIFNHLKKLAKTYRDNANEFYYHFKCPLSKLWDSVCGFDVVEFDNLIGTPDGKSTKQHVLDNYGQKGVDLIMRLISPL